ncbi:hypothetical protein PIB30_026782 [Stylosanthes scabra]|uniref:Uncharacterized protein n=1 Tax=Stylosanthes scabra TaxID=79078 RepID=A0ABU6YCP9_9FABA|nr:hypothetical protein [Stylosanthes scabra]
MHLESIQGSKFSFCQNTNRFPLFLESTRYSFRKSYVCKTAYYHSSQINNNSNSFQEHKQAHSHFKHHSRVIHFQISPKAPKPLFSDDSKEHRRWLEWNYNNSERIQHSARVINRILRNRALRQERTHRQRVPAITAAVLVAHGCNGTMQTKNHYMQSLKVVMAHTAATGKAPAMHARTAATLVSDIQ